MDRPSGLCALSMQQAWAALFGGTSDEVADEPASQNSTDEGHLSITIEEERPEAEQLEILADHETEGLRDEYGECYWVLVADGVRFWLRSEHVDEDVLSAWTSFLSKRRKVGAAADALHAHRQETLSMETKFVVWGTTVQHRKALIHDGRKNENAYPAGAKLNGHNVPLGCKQMAQASSSSRKLSRTPSGRSRGRSTVSWIGFPSTRDRKRSDRCTSRTTSARPKRILRPSILQRRTATGACTYTSPSQAATGGRKGRSVERNILGAKGRGDTRTRFGDASAF